MLAASDLRNRTRGALVGAVVGDAFGAPLEGVAASAAAELVARRVQNPGTWGYTDDGSMFIAVAESIRDTGTVAPVELLRALSRRYEPARGFGRGMKLALRAFEAGVPWQEVALTAWPEGSQGNGGAVRAGAIALRSWATTQDLIAATALATRVTHMHPDAVESALLQVRFVALALYESELLVTPFKAVECVQNHLPRSTFLEQTLEKLRTLVTAAGDVDIGRACGTSTLARESVPAALAVFLRSRGNFADAIINAARLGGDTDSICALVGCLAGALHGVTGIPPRWIQAIEHEIPSPSELQTLADSVSEMPSASFAAQTD